MLILRIRYDGASANARSARPQMGQCQGVSVMNQDLNPCEHNELAHSDRRESRQGASMSRDT